MPKKAAIITALFLFVLVESAIAIPKTNEPKPNNPKIERTTFTESAALGAGNIYLGNQQIDNGTLYVQDAISTGTVNNGDSPISGFEIQTILGGTLDLNTYLGSYNGVWIISGQSGTFEGTINGKVAIAAISGKFVGRGTGSLKGQRMKGTFEGTVNNFLIEITIQATITSRIN